MHFLEEEAAVPLGLRERKRVQTRRTIARVALELFERQGFQATTIPQIAERADVSPRTVSGYFPHKEDLAFVDADEELDAFEARMRDRPAAETTMEALGEFVRAMLEEHDERAAERHRLRRVIRSDDALRAYEHRYTRRAQEIIAAGIARDLGTAPHEIEPRMAAAATMTVFDLLGEDHPDHSAAGRAETLAVIDRALAFIAGGIAALRA